jgi:uncharacterized membrane protein YhaH (DUF805 family)
MQTLGGLFSFRGRLDRVGYWRSGLLLSLLIALVWAGMMFATMASPLGPLAALLFGPILVASSAVTTRRLHDRGKSIWWLLAVAVGAGACFGLAQLLAAWGDANAKFALALMLLGLGLLVWAHVEIGFLRGSAGPNRFGEPPRSKLTRRQGRLTA